MNNLSLLFLITNLLFKKYFSFYSYEFIFSNDFEAQLEWKNHNVPCENDVILFENNTNIVTINENFKASSIVLPTNGILYIGDNIKIGKKGRWQCHKNNVPQKKIFNVSLRGGPNFYDQIHWKIKEQEYHKNYLNSQCLLHFERIPNSKSTIVIPYGKATQIESRKNIKFQKLINRYQVSL